jgi:hypothetical protein
MTIHIKFTTTCFLAYVMSISLATAETMPPPKGPSLSQEIKILKQELQNLRNQYVTQEKTLEVLKSNSDIQFKVAENAEGVNSTLKELTKIMRRDGITFSEWIAILSLTISAILTYLIFKANNRLTGLTGAMETHSQLMLMLEAKKQGVDVIWWDPFFEGPNKKWPRHASHNTKARIKEIFIGLPESRRRKHSIFSRLKVLFSDSEK